MIGFKQFENFTLNCKDRNILVGPNNAGKSTTLDALRIVSDVLRHSKRNRPLKMSQPDDGVCATFNISAQSLSIPIASANRNYSDDPARIEVQLSNSNCLVVILDSREGCSAYLRTDGRIPETAGSFRAAFPIDLVIAPTLGPFEAAERLLNDETVRSSENTRLSHRHFRNILYRKSDSDFQNFSDLVSSTWPAVTIERPRTVDIPANLTMMYYESRIPKEVHWSGFGFQVWLQMLLQISRGNSESVLVLDEPDIYLHPDLQRKLLHLVSGKFGQIFLATHSTEIINEAAASDIVTVNSSFRRGRRIGSEDDYRDLYRYIGSSENAQFSRVARAKRIVFLEGKDARILKKFANKVSSVSLLSDPDTLVLQAGGFGQWQKIVSTGWTLNTMFGLDAKIVALFDRDYRSSAETDDFVTKVSGQGVLCRVLKKKEIENYCLEGPSLVRTVIKRTASRGHVVSSAEAERIIDDCLELLRLDASSNLISSQITYATKKGTGDDPSTLMRRAMIDFDSKWATLEGRLATVCGKEFVSVLSGRIQTDFGTSITYAQLISEMERTEVSPDLVSILGEFESFLAS